MLFFLQPLHVMLVVLSEYVRREQEKQIEYLQVESQILREKIGGSRVMLSDDQRRRLAVKGKALGRRQLGEVAIIAQADTVLRWHRELIEKPREQDPHSKVGPKSRSGHAAQMRFRKERNTDVGQLLVLLLRSVFG